MKITTIIADNLGKTFICSGTALVVLKNISATFVRGSTYAIMGSSGSGKSTLLHILGSLDTPDAGTVFYDGMNAAGYSARQRAHLLAYSLGFVFQTAYLVAELSVVENVMVPGLIQGVPYQQAREKAVRLLEYVGLSDKVTAAPLTLSGGQQQRLALARALFNEPSFLLADELTGNLDAETASQIMDLLEHCRKTWNMGIIISTHDPKIAQRMDYTYRLMDGTLKPCS